LIGQIYTGLSEYSKEMHLLNLTNTSVKWDVTYPDGFYAVFHMRDLTEGSSRVKGLEPRPGSTIQENAFFN